MKFSLHSSYDIMFSTDDSDRIHIYLSAMSILGDIRKVALLVHFVNTLLHWDLLNAFQGQLLEYTELPVLLSFHGGEVETLRKISWRLDTGR